MENANNFFSPPFLSGISIAFNCISVQEKHTFIYLVV